ncbi:MAG: hypothetical protein N4P95_00690, partial [Candidatus Lightella neohaematopini]|nr:hypothetical protein [Candidatus Lightella neohaematopini]
YISNSWWLMITIIITTIVSFIYYLRIIGSTYKYIDYSNIINYDVTKIFCLFYTIVFSLLQLVAGIYPNLLFNILKNCT